MESKDLNPAREEYFEQLNDLFDLHTQSFSIQEEDTIKDQILSITYDSNVELQKLNNDYENAAGKLKVERAELQKTVGLLEAALKEYVEFHEHLHQLGFINRIVGLPIKNATSKLLTPKP